MNLFKNVHESWIPLLHSLAYKEPLVDFLDSLSEISYQPEFEKIFRVFQMPVKDIKVVILGQDPYPRPGDAIGYAFAINKGSKNPVSLRNIIKEIEDTDKDNINKSGEIDLLSWVDQGAFLLNAALTVETGKAGSHLKYWEEFTRTVISFISSENPCTWILWGRRAQSFKGYIKNVFEVKGYNKTTIEEIPIDPTLNYTISAPHPAAEAYAGGKAGFFGSNCFYYTNRVLEKRSLKKIIW